MTSRIAGLVLAAGHSRRFGADKRLATWHGKPLLHHALSTLVQEVDELVVVLKQGDPVGSLLPAALKCRLVFMPVAETGMGDSLAAGIAACEQFQAVLVTLGDLPAVQPGTIAAVRDALTHNDLVQPISAGRAGHPVGFSQAYFAQLKALRGEQGARRILANNRVLPVTVNDPGIYRDIDTREQLNELAKS